MYKLRSYQQQLVAAVRDSFARAIMAVLAVAPTGAGKTVIFAFIAMSAAVKGKRVLVLAHRTRLIRQASKKMAELSVYHGCISPHFTPDPMAPVQIASIQTIIGRIRKRTFTFKPDLIIIDECHHATSPTYREIIAAFPGVRILGVTATPERSDGEGLGVQAGGLFQEMVLGPTTKWLTENGEAGSGLTYLAKPKVYAPLHRLDLSNVAMRAGDYEVKALKEIVDNPRITGDAVAHYRKYSDGEPCIVSCVDVEHSKHVAEEFRASGYRAYSVDGSMKEEDVEAILNGLETGAVQVVTFCDLINEGVDVPCISTLLMLRPTQSLGLFLQLVGRVLRPMPGKAFGKVIDAVGNCLIHGMPDEDREWTLDGLPRKKKGKVMRIDAVRQCPSCYEYNSVSASVCNGCGVPFPVRASQGPKEEAGELQEMDEATAAELKRSKARKIAQAKTLEDLLKVAAELGYKPGWARRYHAAREAKKNKFKRA